MEELAKQLMELFQGSTDVRGVYDMSHPVEVDGKVKGRPHTKMEAPKLEHWVAHLTTPVGLGVSPIEKKGRIDNKVRWAVIDIDKYDHDYTPLLAQLADTPFVPVRTKSGGLNLFVFFKAWQSAGKVRKCLTEISRRIGFGGAEVFPKQSQVLVERGDSSNWVNMPYPMGRKTNRYAVTPTGAPLTLEQFISVAMTKRCALKDLTDLESSGGSVADHPHIPEGPPCLQFLTDNGFPKGSRNRALLNLGVFYKKAYPDKWEELVEEANKKWMSGTRREVQNIIASLSKKDYMYQCTEEPLCSHCDSVTCSQRKHGVSATLQLPSITELTKIKTDPPVYFITIGEQRIGPISSAELMDSMVISRIIFEVTNRPMLIKKIEWLRFLSDLMHEVNELDSPEARGEYGRAMELLREFVTGGHTTDNKQEVIVGRVYVDGNKRLFQLGAFMSFLEQQGVKYSRNQIVAILKEEKLKTKVIKVKEKQYRTWVLDNVDRPVELDGDKKDDTF